MTPTNTEGKQPRQVQKGLFDLDTMQNVTLIKRYDFTPVVDTKSAMERVGGNTEKFIEIINRGLVSFEDEKIKANNEVPWLVEDEDGKTTPFAGTPADDKAVNGLVLNMAKASFGYMTAKNADEKRASKDKALAFIKSSPVLIEGMKAQLLAQQASDAASE